MTNALLLRPGDRLPDFALPGLDGKFRKFLWSFNGWPVALLVVDDLKALDTAQFASLIARCKDASVVPVVVAGMATPAASPIWSKLIGGASDAPLLLCDGERRFVPALLSQAGIGFGQTAAARTRIILLDPNQHVAATYDSRPLLAAAEGIGAAAERVRSSAGADVVIAGPMAPVLVLPRVFEPEFCTQVIRLWEKGDHQDSGVSSRYGNVGVAELKRTEDYMIAEPMMQKAISDRLAYRIGPELVKVFAFDHQFTFDAHVVLSYSADGGHFFSAHRDNGAPTTADRAFAVSLNLNDDFDGGELVFPEFSAVKAKPPAGAAAVFSCGLLHEALPVTRGRRFVLTTFFRQKK
ncbi:2OG-Fe(II) oxygenase [Enhydrobacter aerosaccus]|nr:2OG-Fe(II) oxygenase [Enhydrobacter aerosaccus]